ncbi:hypothetical protein PLESTM_001336300 [Pleodorina starrii]|nr:hypothetical protein PLESTM_001336300 [Pleodorina starrii]
MEFIPFPIMVVPGILIALTLLTAAILLGMRRKAPTKSKEALSLGEPEVQGTVYVSDGEGHTVRRSTRPRKPIASPGYVVQATPVKAEGAAATPRRSTRSSSATTAAVRAAPENDEQPLTPLTRSRRTPRI